MINGLDLFSGIGGISLALQPWVKTVAYCERDSYCQGIILSRINEGLLDDAPIWDDIQTFPTREIKGKIDIIFGGFPCQDISIAGLGKGLEGKRSGLFFEILRLAREIRPAFVFLENVPAIRTRGLGVVVESLANERYDCRWIGLSASECGAPHKRNRWFLLAHSSGVQLWEEQVKEFRIKDKTKSITNGSAQYLANSDSSRELQSQGLFKEQWDGSCNSGKDGDSNSKGLEIRQQRKTKEQPSAFRADWWSVEPNVGRMANGIQNRVDRIRSLGNSVVPLQAQKAFIKLIGFES